MQRCGRRLDPEWTARAEAYPYHFRRVIPMPGLDRARMQGSALRDHSAKLGYPCARGADTSLDCVRQGILEGTQFVFDDA